MVSSRSGSIGDASSHGLFLLDTRVLSRWQLAIDGWTIEPLLHAPSGPFSATFVARARRPGEHDSPIALVHRRYVGNGMHDDVEIRNHGPSRSISVRLAIATDLAGMFEVKAGNAGLAADRPIAASATPDGFVFLRDGGVPGIVDSVAIKASQPPDELDATHGVIGWHVAVDAGGTWTTCVEVSATSSVPP